MPSTRHSARVSLRTSLFVALISGVIVAAMGSTRLDASPTPKDATVQVKAAGVSLQYPRRWIVFASTKKGIAAQQRHLSRKNPRLADAFSAAAQISLLPSTKFQASDLGVASAGRVSDDVRIEVVPGGFPSSLQNFTTAREPSVQQAGGTVLDATTVTIGGQTAYRLDVILPVRGVGGTLSSVRLGQLLIQHGDGRTVITVGAPDDAAGSKLVDAILRSIRRI